MKPLCKNFLAIIIFLMGCQDPAPVTPEINIVTVQQRDITVAVEAAGIIEPETTVELKSKASGEILGISADTGSRLEAGDLIVQIDKRTPRNALNQAEAELEAAIARKNIARSQEARAAKLHKSGTMNLTEYEQNILEHANATAEVVRGEVAVENARIALDDTEVRAPITGTMIEKQVEVGQVISSPTSDVGGGTVLLKMADLSAVQVRALVDETDIGKITPDQQVLVTVTAYPNIPFIGRVLKIEPMAEDQSNVTMFAVLVSIANDAYLLRPGMNAEVTIKIASAIDVLAVPTVALRTLRDTEAAESYLDLAEGSLMQELLATKPKPTDAPPGSNNQFGGRYWVLVQGPGETITPTWVMTGVTDFDYSEIQDGVSLGEAIVMLPSSGLIRSQQRFQEFMSKLGGMPGMGAKDDKGD